MPTDLHNLLHTYPQYYSTFYEKISPDRKQHLGASRLKRLTKSDSWTSLLGLCREQSNLNYSRSAGTPLEYSHIYKIFMTSNFLELALGRVAEKDKRSADQRTAFEVQLARIFDFVVRFITSSSSCSLVCSCAVLGTYRVWWAGVSSAAAEGWRGGSGRSCSASCSSYTRTRELWPLCCWTKGAPLSRWWPTGAGSWLSSDCAKAWSGNVLLQETGEENGGGVSDVDGQSGQRLLDKWTITITIFFSPKQNIPYSISSWSERLDHI